MNFIAPLWFLLGAAAAVPLLVHLLRRRSGATTEFPAARYLLRAEREHSRSIRLRNLLLMLLRVLAVLLLAVAAARPMGRLAGGPGGHAPTAVAIVLDNSLSTAIIDGGRPVFEVLRDAARAVVNATGPDDRIHLVTVDGRIRAGARESALAALAAIEPIAGAGDVAAAVRRASAAAVADRSLVPRVVVLTDGQATTWAEPVELSDAPRVVVAAPGTAAPANRGVTMAQPRPLRWMPAGALHVRIHAADSTPLRIELGPPGARTRTLARAVAAAGEPLVVRASAPDTGLLAGRVAIDGDELPGDDVRHFALRAAPAPRVSVLPGAGPFIRSAVDAVRETGAVRVGDGIRVLAADEVRAGLAGALLVVAPASPARLGAANAALSAAGVPWRFRAAAPAGTARGDSGMPRFSVRHSYALAATGAAPADTLVTVNGRPWAVAGVANDTRYVVIASALTPDATDLPVRAAFVPWVASLLARLAGADGDVVGAAPGQLLRRQPAWDSLAVPDGGVVPIEGTSFAAPLRPGVYLARGGGRITGALVVNVEENESVIDRLQVEEVAGRIRAGDVVTARMDDALPRTVLSGMGARSLVAPVLAVVLLVLGLEAFVTARRARGPA